MWLYIYSPPDEVKSVRDKLFNFLMFLFQSFVAMYRTMVFPVSRIERPLQRYNEQGLRIVVGCIPYRYKAQGNEGTSNEVEILVISSPKSEEMMFPKGGLELNESLKEAASRETFEEAGVLGAVEYELGEWQFKSKSQEIYHEGHMFPLLVTEQLDQWPEKDVRKRVWMSVSEAGEVCKQWWMKEALDRLVHRLPSQDDLSRTDQSSRRGKELALATSMEQSVLEDNSTAAEVIVEKEDIFCSLLMEDLNR